MRGQTLIAWLGPGAVRVTAKHGAREVWTAERQFDNEDELSGVLASLAEPVAKHRLPRRLLVMVQPPVLQCRVLSDLPPVRPSELRLLVARAAPRYFRQNGHPLVSNAAWIEKHGETRRQAKAVALDGLVAEAIVAGARRAALSLTDIIPDGEPGGLSLLPLVEQSRRRRDEWLAIGRLAIGVSCLWLLLATALALRLHRESGQIAGELRELREPRQALLAARLAIDSADAMIRALDHAQAVRGQVLAQLAALITALPDSTVLTGLTLNLEGSGVATGRTRRASLMVGALEGAGTLKRVSLEGPTVRDTVAGLEWERFSLRFGRERTP